MQPIDKLWDSANPSSSVFVPSGEQRIPTQALRYFTHAIAPGTHLASAVRLKMHGEIKLKKWYPFTAEEVIVRDRGMIWRASARMGLLRVTGSDSIVDGTGSMHWSMFGIIPVMQASGPDITRSAAGRAHIEAVWLPPLLWGTGTAFPPANSGFGLQFEAFGDTSKLDCITTETGALRSVSVQRWGNPEGSAFHLTPFGAYVDEERTFGGYTIPSMLRVGWYFGTDRFDQEGEFFRASVDDAIYR